MEPLAVPVGDAIRALGIKRTKLYELIGRGDLESLTIGRRRLIKTDSIRRLINPNREAA